MLGHEAVGVVEEVCPWVRDLRPDARLGSGGAAGRAGDQQAPAQSAERIAPKTAAKDEQWVPGDGA